MSLGQRLMAMEPTHRRLVLMHPCHNPAGYLQLPYLPLAMPDVTESTHVCPGQSHLAALEEFRLPLLLPSLLPPFLMDCASVSSLFVDILISYHRLNLVSGLSHRSNQSGHTIPLDARMMRKPCMVEYTYI